MAPRNRALVTARWMTGFCISEVLRWTVGTVTRNSQIISKIGLSQRQMKGGYGKTRWVPLLPELRRALEGHVGWLERRLILSPDLLLFLSREGDTSIVIQRSSIRPNERSRSAKSSPTRNGEARGRNVATGSSGRG
jgi:integrase